LSWLEDASSRVDHWVALTVNGETLAELLRCQMAVTFTKGADTFERRHAHSGIVPILHAASPFFFLGLITASL
jgi:hypothetical protein